MYVTYIKIYYFFLRLIIVQNSDIKYLKYAHYGHSFPYPPRLVKLF